MRMREGIAPIMPGYSVMREYPRTLKPFGMTRKELTELLAFAKEAKLEKETLQEVLLQKEVAEMDGYHPNKK